MSDEKLWMRYEVLCHEKRLDPNVMISALSALVSESVAAEREACAKTLDVHGCLCDHARESHGYPRDGKHWIHCPVAMQARIRSRGTPTASSEGEGG